MTYDITHQILDTYRDIAQNHICDGNTPEEADIEASSYAHELFDEVVGVMNVSKALSYFRSI